MDRFTATVYVYDDIPKAIKAAREKREWSKFHTAELSGISRSQYSRIENGEAMKISVIEDICHALGLILTVKFGVKKDFSQKPDVP